MCIRFDVEEGIAWVILDRPVKLNALDSSMLADLGEALDRFEADPEVGVVILTGEGEKAFCAGSDIGEFRNLDFEQAEARIQTGQALTTRIETFPKPILAAINGYAFGGGCELALACHIRIASALAQFALPEAKLGIIPGYGGTQRLARIAGRSLAMDMLLTGEPIDATRALEAGLVSRIFPPEELLDGAERMARVILTRAPLALSAIISTVGQGLNLSLESGLQYEAMLLARVLRSQDAQEGTKAFVEKRAPRFIGA